MSAAAATAVAMTFLWLGMVLAISFIETPLKFRAPDVTLRVGLGIGRLVFRALNTAEGVLALVLLVAILLDPPAMRVLAPMLLAVAVLVVQVLLVRPRLNRRSDAVLAGEDAPRSHAHLAYVAVEVIKVIALAVGGSLLLVA